MRTARKGDPQVAPSPAVIAHWMARAHEVTAVMAFFTEGDTTTSNLIARVAGRPTHTGLLFRLSDGWYYMEALIGRDIQPPQRIEHLQEWALKNEKRQATAIALDNSVISGHALAARHMFQRAMQDVGRCTYFPLQLLALWAAIRFHLPMRPSPGKVICSEWAALLFLYLADLRPEGQPLWDRLTPAQMWQALSRHPAAVKIYNLKKELPA